MKRVRLALALEASIGLLPCGNVDVAQVYDIAFDVREGANPLLNDLELAGVDAGQSGLHLSATQQVKVTVRNASYRAYSGEVSLKLTHGGQMHTQVYDFGSEALAPGATRVIPLAATVDLSTIGMHEVAVELAERPSVVNAENNGDRAEVWCVVPAATGQYAMHLTTSNRKGEYLDLASVSKRINPIANGDALTMEMWLNLDMPQLSRVMQAKGLIVYTLYRVQGNLPDNAWAIALGENKMVYTRENSLMAKGWHHVAFVLYDMKTVSHACPVEVYIDGELQALTVVGQDGQDTLPLFDELRLGLDFNGKVDGLRARVARRLHRTRQAAEHISR